MKKIVVVSILFLSFLSILIIPFKVEAKTLRDHYNNLDSLKELKAKKDKEKEKTEEEKNQINKEIYNSTEEIENCEVEINNAIIKIGELKIEITEKKAEIENLMRFMQISDGNNAYLEYIFGASDFTDFIYRSAVVEQLSKYNDQLIKEMNDLIEKNKQLQIDLANRQKELKNLIAQLRVKLKSLNSDLDEISDIGADIAAQIKAQQELINYYKKMGCEMDQKIIDCVKVPVASGFIRPLKKGRISSDYGKRKNPINGRTQFHYAIDISRNPEGTPVYASAPGIVGTLERRTECGGNRLYINHITANGEKYSTMYYHLLKYNVKTGDYVDYDTVIGYVGGGKTTQVYDTCTDGAHLHFGIGKGWYGEYDHYSDWIANVENPRIKISFPAKGQWFYSRY